MTSRIAIEQKLADLEITLNLQEELLNSQRTVIKGLKDLLKAEFLSLASSSTSILSDAVAATSIAITSRDPTRGIHHASINNKNNNSPSVLAGSSHKRKRSSPKQQSENDPLSSSSAKRPYLTAPDRVDPKPTILHVHSDRRRRALEKVKQLCRVLPPLFPVIAHKTKSHSPNAFLTSSDVNSKKVKARSSNHGVKGGGFVSISSEAGPNLDAVNITMSGGMSPFPHPHLSSIIDPKKLAKSREAIKQVNVLEQIVSLDDRLEAAKDLKAKLTVNPKECRKLMENGGKELLFSWLRDLDTDAKPTLSVPVLIEYLLELLDIAVWSQMDTSKTRIDKV